MSSYADEVDVAVGAKITAANWNAYVAANMTWLAGGGAGLRPSLRTRMVAAQSIPNNTSTTVKFDTEDEDTDTAYDPSTGIWTCETGGLYLFAFNMAFASNGTGTRTTSIVSGGSPVGANPVPVSAAVDGLGRANGTLIGRLAVGQTVLVSTNQTSGGALNTGTAGLWFNASLLSL